jgi:flagellar basal body P-ring protein FlgI
MISYTSKRKEERILIKDILSNFGINVHENDNSGDLDFCGYYNLKKFQETNIFAYHSYRKLKLIKGIANLEKNHIPDLNKDRITLLLKERNYLTSSRVSKYLNLSYECAKKHLRELECSNKINKINGFGSIPHQYFIIH